MSTDSDVYWCDWCGDKPATPGCPCWDCAQMGAVPTKLVVVSGSRSITKLPKAAIASLTKIVEQDFHILIGDAPGVDTLVQEWLVEQGRYEMVSVWHTGAGPRNNMGAWQTVSISGSYTDRDKVMCQRADYGLAIWDGRSPGTKRNINQLGQRCKVIDSRQS